jgi:hypothetical protein
VLAQCLSDNSPTTPPRFQIWPVHSRDRRTQADCTEGAKHLQVITKAALAQFVPGNLSGSI